MLSEQQQIIRSATWFPCGRGNSSKIFDPLQEQRKALLSFNRPKKEGDGRNALEWRAPVDHVTVRWVRARLVATIKGSSSRCSIEIITEDRTSQELAYSRGLLQGSSLRVLWLGRSNMRPAHDRVRSQRTIECVLPGKGEKPVSKSCTVSEAVFGMLCKIAQRLGAWTLDLHALDNGSGRLIQYYEDLGLRKDAVEEGVQGMCGDIEDMVPLAPEAWVNQLMPADFDGPRWFFEAARHHRASKRPLALGRPGCWHWDVEWPFSARVVAQLTRGVRDNASWQASASLNSLGGNELAYAQGNISIQEGLLRVMTLGESRSNSRPDSFANSRPTSRANSRASSLTRQRNGRSESKESSEDECSENVGIPAESKVNASEALLGVLAVLAQSVGATAAEVILLEPGSRRLLDHLRSICPEDLSVLRPSTVCVGFACEDLIHHCCPKEWQSELPPTKDPSAHGGQVSLSAVSSRSPSLGRTSPKLPALASRQSSLGRTMSTMARMETAHAGGSQMANSFGCTTFVSAFKWREPGSQLAGAKSPSTDTAPTGGSQLSSPKGSCTFTG
mmetsp:Transcript_96751/g.181961  ORF Transcript_96751/g.181961 Transcript_96751/m.181961 type:complete len:560 (-) Transcript_96751:186-1865(-)